MATPIVQYLFDQASSGTAPTSLLDTAPGTAINLPINYGTATHWTSNGAGKGISFDGSGIVGNTIITGSKIDTALTGGKTIVIEAVYSFPLTDNASSFGFGNVLAQYINPGDHQAYSAGQPWSSFLTTNYSGVSAGVHAIHWSYDATSTPTLRTYVDGVVINTTTTSSSGNSWNFNPSAIAIGGDETIVRFGGGGGWRQITGEIYYWALYSNMTVGEIASNAAALILNNDANPNSPAVVGYPVYWFRA